MLVHFITHVWMILSNQKKQKLTLLVFLSGFSAMFEALNIGMVVPFTAILAGLSSASSVSYANVPFFEAEDLLHHAGPLEITLIFCSVTIFSGVLKFVLVRQTNHTCFEIGAEIGSTVFQNIIKQDYEYFLQKNSSEVISSLVSRVNLVAYNVILPLVTVIASVVSIILILSVLFFINAWLALVLPLIFAGLYFGTIYSFRSKIANASRRLSVQSEKTVNLAQESFFGIRDVILTDAANYLALEFKKTFFDLHKTNGAVQSMSLSPRPIIETLVIIILALSSYILLFDEDWSSSLVLPTLAAFAFAGQRLLPMVQQIYSAFTTVQSQKHNMEILLSQLQTAPETQSDLHGLKQTKLVGHIELNDLSYSYPNSSKMVLKNINLKINKGDFVGVSGASGSGKSTLLDLTMGLLHPTKGSISIGGQVLNRADLELWRAGIGHLSQHVHMIDSSLIHNIGYSMPIDEVDAARAIKSAEIAQLDRLFPNDADLWSFSAGENGQNLSGGQRQRVGLARALYHAKNLLVLDEVTSAVDGVVEERIMDALKNFREDKTVIIASHSVEVLKRCDYVIAVEDGEINVE